MGNYYNYGVDAYVEKVEAEAKLQRIKSFAKAGIVLGVIGGIIYGFMFLGIFKHAAAFLMVLVAPVLCAIGCAWALACLYVGWVKLDNGLRRILPDFILIMPIIGWLILIGIKLSLANIVGVFSLPFEYRRLKKIVNSDISANTSASQSALGWTCPRCGTHNSNHETHCFECGERKTPTRTTVVLNETGTKWICNNCGKPNSKIMSQCTSCGKYKSS